MIKGVRNLKYGEILSILGELYREGETGTLLCQSGATAKYIYFQGGQVIFAASNAFEDKFTQILLEEGKIKEEQIDMAMEKKGNKTIAKTLTELGFISSADLIDSLIKQVYRIASSILKWEEGSATFKPDSLPQGVAKLPLSTQRLVLDLARSIENRHYVMQIIGGIDKIVAIHKAEMDVVMGLPLNPDEIQMAKAADGKKTIENIATVSQSNAFTTAKFFIGLYYLGLAHPKKIIESVNDAVQKEEMHQEEKKLDLSFLDQALPTTTVEEEKKEEKVQTEEKPFQTIVPEAENFKPLTIEEKEEAPIQIEEPSKVEDKTEKAAEEKKETEEDKKEEVVQPPLFSPTFLPPDEDKEILISEKPKIHLPPLNPLPKKKRSKMKIAVFSVMTIAVVFGAVFGILYLFEENEKEKTTPPPPSVPKATYSQSKEVKPQSESQQKQVANEESKPQEAAVKEKLPEEKQEAKQEEKLPLQKPSVEEEKKTEPKKEIVSVVEKENIVKETSADPYENLIKGNYEEAAKAFKSIYSSKRGGFTIAIMLACEKDSIAKAFASTNNSKDLIIFPYNYKGRNCFRVIWGYFKTREEAEEAFGKIPKEFKDSGAKVVGFETMKP